MHGPRLFLLYVFPWWQWAPWERTNQVLHRFDILSILLRSTDILLRRRSELFELWSSWRPLIQNIVKKFVKNAKCAFVLKMYFKKMSTKSIVLKLSLGYSRTPILQNCTIWVHCTPNGNTAYSYLYPNASFVQSTTITDVIDWEFKIKKLYFCRQRCGGVAT